MITQDIDQDTLNEVEAHGRELKAAYQAATAVLRAAEKIHNDIRKELERWERKTEYMRQRAVYDERQQCFALEALIEERETVTQW